MMQNRRRELSYEAQQAELRKLREQNGEGESDDGSIRVHEAVKEPEVNPEVYRDVEPYLFRGFLTQHAMIGETNFVFKTLNHHEHELIRLSGGYDEKGHPTKSFWSFFIAYSVLMVDGMNVLMDRDRWILKSTKELEEFQASVKTKIVRYLSELNRRARNAVTLTECYVTEKYSRYRWFQLHGMDMTSTAVTGITGTDQLGLNWAQLIWRALNRIDDLRDGLEQQWEHAKFVGSCSAGKGIQKVYQQDSDRRRKEKETLVTRKDAILRHVIAGEPLRDDRFRIQAGGAVMVTAQSVDDLVKQLRDDLGGEKDWHDHVVDTYEGRMQRDIHARSEQIQEMAKQREEEFGGKSLVGGTDMAGLSSAEVRDRMIRQQQVHGQLQATGRIPATETPPPALPALPARPTGQPFRGRR